MWQKYLDEVEKIRLTEYWKRYYPLRSITIERIFVDAKEKHGARFTSLKGINKVLDETRIIFVCMNMKKMTI
ncbi:MAG: transposase [Bacilli bacterium]|nr:transposase [Bacilli bacterium]